MCLVFKRFYGAFFHSLFYPNTCFHFLVLLDQSCFIKGNINHMDLL